MLPILQVGPLALPLPPLLLLLGIWIGVELTERQAGRYGTNPDVLLRMTFTALAAGVVGARLVYALQYPQAFLASPLSLLSPRPEMLDLPGGLLAGGLAALIYGQRKKVPLWPALDGLTSLFSALAVALGLSHLASGDAFGAPAQLPWSIWLWGAWRHPSQVYEILAALGLAAAAWPGGWISTQAIKPGRQGLRFLAYAALYAAAALFLEAFRGDSLLLVERFRAAQVAAWAVLALALWLIGRRLNHAFRRTDGSSADL